MKTTSWLLSWLLVFGLSLAMPVQAKPRGGIATVAFGCSYPIDGGCLGANQNGNFKDASLLTSAQQSGQTSLLPTHPMSFNIPGVDYPISYDKTLTLKDPRTINDSVCAFVQNGSNPFVGCTGGAATVVNYVIDGYDFCGNIIGQTAVLIFEGSSAQGPAAGSTMQFTNNNVCAQSTGTGALFVTNGNWKNTIKFNQFDNSVHNYGLYPFQDNGSTASAGLDVEYNAFTNIWSARIMNGGLHGAWNRTWKYNFVQGMQDGGNANGNGTHGELDIFALANTTINTYEGSNNFFIFNGSASFNQTTAAVYFSTGNQSKYVVTNTVSKQNVIVTNTWGSPPTTISGHNLGHAFFNGGWASLGNVALTDNWIDATGSTDCGLNGNTSQGLTGSQTGNVLTITAFPGSGWTGNDIEAGWNVNHSSYTQTTIQTFGSGGTTGTGGLGTYLVDGASQPIGSDSGWTLTPGIVSATLTNNFNLRDGTAIGFNGPRLQATSCVGAHN